MAFPIKNLHGSGDFIKLDGCLAPKVVGLQPPKKLSALNKHKKEGFSHQKLRPLLSGSSGLLDLLLRRAHGGSSMDPKWLDGVRENP